MIDLNGQEEYLALKSLEKFEDEGDFDIAEREAIDKFENERYEQNSDRMAE